MFHIPNGGQRSKITGAQLKAAGVRPGVPDIFLPLPRQNYAGLFIELKKLKGSAEPAQIEWKNYLNSSGYYATVCHGWLEAVNVIEQYLKLK